MPKQLGSALMFTVSLVAIVLAANRAQETAEVTADRGPASLGGDFENVGAPFRHTEKLHGPVEVSIDLIGPAPAAAGDVFVLKGVVSSAQRLDNVEYRWAVPASVELVNGQQKGVIEHLDAQRAVDFELTLRARDGGNAQVHLLANARSRGARFAESAQYNTTKEREFAASRDRLMKSTATSETERLKVYH